MSRYCAEPSQGHGQQDETRVQSIHDFPVKAGFTGESDKFRSPSALARANAGFEAMAPCYGWRSPHTRGALRAPAGRHRRRRIIPAYAGSTWKSRWCVVQERDHPRIRGEHHAILCTKVRDKGSSPHTRGALTEDYDEVIAARIIPAYAGSTSLWILTRRWRWDHPRIRGEHRAELYEVSVVAGSSPHTRGALTR